MHDFDEHEYDDPISLRWFVGSLLSIGAGVGLLFAGVLEMLL